MSEDLGELYRKEGLLLRDDKWDEAIAVYTEIIRLENDPERKAGGYTKRGLVSLSKGDYDRAIADYDKAIELNPQDAAAYGVRALVHIIKGDHDRAITDYDKAIKLNPTDAAAYRKRGLAYGFKGDYDRVIADCDKAIELNSQDAAAYGNRGCAYIFKGDYDRAITDCDKAIELNPQNAAAYGTRGDAYSFKGDYASALDDFFEADRQDKSLKSNYVLAYIAYSLEGITSDREERAGLFKSYWALTTAIDRISTKLFYEFTDAGEVAHYTSLHGLRALAERDNPFRLYNSSYMNDPEEGQVFFEIMRKETGINVEKIFYKLDAEDPHSSPAYIGSFVKTESHNAQEKDKLFLWRTYGKHDNEEAVGACLIFNKDQFAQDVPSMKIGTMHRQEYVAKQGEPIRPNNPPALYRVVYKSESEELSKSLGKLALSLKEIEELLGFHSEEHKERLIKLVRELLDRIRFLFKADHYREEQEVRVIEMSYDTGGEKPQECEVAMEQMPPRFYLNIPCNVRFSEVILGPKTHGLSEWQRHLKKSLGNRITVRKSEIKFGRAYQ